MKILAEHLSDDEHFVARFRREALAVAKLIHPNIVQVYDTGVDDGRHYIVMEYVEGRSGAQLLQAEGRLGPETAVEIGVQACAGLDYAHRQGIIHRDVKPGNLMIIGGPAGRRRDDRQAHRLRHRPGQRADPDHPGRLGRRHRRLPRARAGARRGGDARSDVYALGVVLYQFLTGRLPYEGASLAELAVRQQNEQPLPPSSYNDDVPEALGDAVLRRARGRSRPAATRPPASSPTPCAAA